MTATLAAVRVGLRFPTQRYGLTSVELEPGRIGHHARELFSFGYCHYLTSALHEQTGWPLVIMQQATVQPDGWRWAHTAVRAGRSGQVLDIGGVAGREQIATRYSSHLGCGVFRWTQAMSWGAFAAAIGLAADSQPSWWRSTRLGQAAGPVIESYVTQLVSVARERGGS